MAHDPHERALVGAFLPRGRRDQFLARLGNPKTRPKLLGQLAHFHGFDPRFAHRIPPGDQTVEKIYRLLKEKGASETCHVTGASDLDGHDVGLRAALEQLVDPSFGNFVSCVPGKLAYFGGEAPNERYILERWASGTPRDVDGYDGGGA